MVTNKQTDRQTNAGDYIIPRESFRGDNEVGSSAMTFFYKFTTESFDEKK